MIEEDWVKDFEAACKLLVAARDKSNRLRLALTKPMLPAQGEQLPDDIEEAKKEVARMYSEVRRLLDIPPVGD